MREARLKKREVSNGIDKNKNEITSSASFVPMGLLVVVELVLWVVGDDVGDS